MSNRPELVKIKQLHLSLINFSPRFLIISQSKSSEIEPTIDNNDTNHAYHIGINQCHKSWSYSPLQIRFFFKYTLDFFTLFFHNLCPQYPPTSFPIISFIHCIIVSPWSNQNIKKFIVHKLQLSEKANLPIPTNTENDITLPFWLGNWCHTSMRWV